MNSLKTHKKFVFDLHSHTKHSDGELSVVEILKKAEENKIKLFSITDHSSVGAYLELRNFHVHQYYSGEILTGCEMESTFDGAQIEILAYGVDVDKLNAVLKEIVSPEWLKNKKDRVLEQHKANGRKIGLMFDADLKMTDYKMGESCTFLMNLWQFPENKKFFKDDVWKDRTAFYRQEVINKNSPFFVDLSTYYRTPKEIVDLIHSCGGKAFLAHYYIYGFENDKETLDKFIESSGADGIECYYSTFSKENVQFLVNYCKENNLLISGGSDFHGSFRPQSELGVPNRHLHPERRVLDWTKKLLKNQVM